MFFRDLFQDCDRLDLPEDYDLTTNNPYLNGLEYPLLERLIPKPIDDSSYGKGQILVKGPQSYHVRYGTEHYLSCRTYEYAYYARKCLQECNWNKSKIPEIIEGYPEWYTWLLNFYKYIQKRDGKWALALTPKQYGKLDLIYFNNLEDALWERDLYVKYDFDDELVVYYADDKLNPYYNMDLPPYPQRKIRRVHDRESHREELDYMIDYILEYGDDAGITHFCEEYDFNAVSIRKWLKNYNVTFNEFKDIVLAGENPWDVLELKPLIYTPDLSRYYNNNGYIQVRHGVTGDRFIVNRHPVYYGSYPSRDLAEKVVKELHKCDWDKSQMPRINERIGFESMVNSKRWVYPNPNGSFSVRHKDKNRKMINFGTYWDKEKAEFVRDKLIECGWSKDFYNNHIRPLADKLYPDRNIDKYIYRIKRKYDVYFTVGRDGQRFGKFKDKNLARVMRDFLVNNGWDWDACPGLLGLCEWICHCQRLYKYSFIKKGGFL